MPVAVLSSSSVGTFFTRPKLRRRLAGSHVQAFEHLGIVVSLALAWYSHVMVTDDEGD